MFWQVMNVSCQGERGRHGMEGWLVGFHPLKAQGRVTYCPFLPYFVHLPHQLLPACNVRSAAAHLSRITEAIRVPLAQQPLVFLE